MTDRRGYAYGLAAFGLWGLFPLYWKLVEPSGPVEILAHRIVWSLVFVAGLLAVLRRWSWLRGLARQPGKLLAVLAAAVTVAVNWGTYIHGVTTDRVVETSLGYYINPLVSVLLGVVVLHERMRTAQWGAIGIGALAVVVLTVDYGQPPWIALTLAFSFGTYGLVKKRLGLPAAEGLFVESAALALPALGYLGWLWAAGEQTFGSVSTGHTLLLLGGGAVTAIPLLFFAGAANRMPLSALGLMQYLTPTMQFALGVLLFHEPMPPARQAGFALVWLALAVFSWDALRHYRRSRGVSGRRQPGPADRRDTRPDRRPGDPHHGADGEPAGASPSPLVPEVR
ncbi:MAG TPA: EamA family transporter RarD [Micromonosporaceae bacterium]